MNKHFLWVQMKIWVHLDVIFKFKLKLNKNNVKIWVHYEYK